MSNYINQVSDSLKNHISELANNPCLFLRNPNVDFSRKRKIDFKTFIGIMMNSGGATMSKELLDFFDFNKNTPSVSAFTQQRSKVLPEAFEYLFKSFTDDNLPTTNNYHGYRLIACEGSNLTIATNQKDARLLLYNYCELITTHVIKQMKNNDKTKQVNSTIAIYICREYLRNKRNLSPPDVINLIEKHVLPVRPGRKGPRKVKPQASVSFLYRVT